MQALDRVRTGTLRTLFILMIIAHATAAAGPPKRSTERSDASTEVRIVALGDSITAGWPFFHPPSDGQPEAKGDPSAPYTFRISQLRPSWKVFNFGVNGERTNQVLARLGRQALAPKPRLVVVLAGVNDVYQRRPVEEIHEHLRTLYECTLAGGSTPMAASILPFNAAAPEQSAAIHALNAWIEQESRRLKIPFCDLAPIAADPKNPDRLKGSPDDLHPDRAIYRAMGDAVVACIERNGGLSLEPARQTGSQSGFPQGVANVHEA